MLQLADLMVPFCVKNGPILVIRIRQVCKCMRCTFMVLNLKKRLLKKQTKKRLKSSRRQYQSIRHMQGLWLVLSWAYYFDCEFGWSNEPLKLKELQNRCIRKAVELDPRDPLALKETRNSVKSMREILKKRSLYLRRRHILVEIIQIY